MPRLFTHLLYTPPTIYFVAAFWASLQHATNSDLCLTASVHGDRVWLNRYAARAEAHLMSRLQETAFAHHEYALSSVDHIFGPSMLLALLILTIIQ